MSAVQNNELDVLVTNENDTVKSYDLVSGQVVKGTQINRKNVVCHGTCKMFHGKKLSLLSGQFNDATKTWRLRLYQSDDSKAQILSWAQVSQFRFSVLKLDLKNTVLVYASKDDEIIVISVLNQETRQTTPSIVIYSFPLKASGYYKAASFPLPSRIRKCEIYSCIIVSNDIYCCLLSEVGGYIYKIGLASLNQHQKEMHNMVRIPTDHMCSWKTEDSTWQNCFLAMLKEEVMMISFSVADNKSIMKVKQLTPSELPSVDFKFVFPSIVRVITASIVPGNQNPLLAVLYHDIKANKCCIKRFDILLSV